MKAYVGCIPIQKQVYLNSERTMCIKHKIEFQTGSDKNVLDHTLLSWCPFQWWQHVWGHTHWSRVSCHEPMGAENHSLSPSHHQSPPSNEQLRYLPQRSQSYGWVIVIGQVYMYCLKEIITIIKNNTQVIWSENHSVLRESHIVDRCVRKDSSSCDPSRITQDHRFLVMQLGSQLEESILMYLSTIFFFIASFY